MKPKKLKWEQGRQAANQSYDIVSSTIGFTPIVCWDIVKTEDGKFALYRWFYADHNNYTHEHTYEWLETAQRDAQFFWDGWVTEQFLE
jgi:hypothetical protein